MSQAEHDGLLVDPHGWPVWPIFSSSTAQSLLDVMRSGRWSISGANMGGMPMERRFAMAFAAWMGLPHCIPTANGTSALLAALDALGIGVGDEVIVPGLTWVAPAIAVLQMNALPILVDIDASTLCIAPDAIQRAITENTKAIIVVHLYCSVADMARIGEIAQRHHIAVIEDCAQSHGSEWQGRRVGSLGTIGVFSLHQGKPLTSGEGGMAVTTDAELASRMEQLRANGRRYAIGDHKEGTNGLQEIGQVLGTNMAMSEFHSALALDGLSQLDRLNRIRQEAATFLDREIAGIPGFGIVNRPLEVSLQSYYHYVVRFDAERLNVIDAAALADELTRRLGFPWQTSYVPMNRHPLYRPRLQARYRLSEQYLQRIEPAQFGLPNSETIFRTSVIAHHRMLLADRTLLQRIPEVLQDLARRDALPHL